MTSRIMPVSRMVVILALFLTGCSMKVLTVRSMDPIMDDMRTAVNRNTDVDLLRDAMPASHRPAGRFHCGSPG